MRKAVKLELAEARRMAQAALRKHGRTVSAFPC